MKKFFIKSISVLLCVLIPVFVFSQETRKVKLNRAEKLLGVTISGVELNILTGDVELQHDETLFYCDSAVLIKLTNSFKAYENVYIMVNDSVDIYGDSMHYDGNTRIAEIFGDVKLIDNKATLYTNLLEYNRNTEIAYYYTGGRIIDKENELVSIIGYYYSEYREFFFKDDVVVTTPDYLMYSDTLKYNTDNEIVYIYGPTNIIGEEDSVYCEYGWYDTKSDIAYLKINAFVQHLEQTISGDSLFYNKEEEFGWGLNNVVVTDSVQDVIITGNKARYEKMGHFSSMTDSAMAIFIDNLDSLYMHADTIKVIFDSTDQPELVKAYNKVKFFRDDMQGACDSLVYYVKDSTFTMYKNPVLWSDENQLTSDSIKMVILNSQIDTMVFYGSCFIIALDDTGTYNQIKGKNMIGYFRHNELYKLSVFGNSQTIYFVREEEGELIGVNKAEASDMLIFLKDRQMKTITYLINPKATLYPEKDLHPQDLKLRGFKWHGYNKPLKIADIFNWVPEDSTESED